MNKKIIILSLFFGVIFLFIFLRFYLISSSFEFYNDIGRDNLVLLNWSRTGKPPLLGPQTSVMPFNQSALYFYILFPMFLLTQMSLYNTLITCAVLYIGVFLYGIYAFRNNARMLKVLFVVSVLFTIYPQLIMQQRFVWNPSFLPLFLSISVFAYLFLLKKVTWKMAVLFGVGGALAVSFNYSAVLLVLPILLHAIVFLRKKSMKLFVSFFISMICVNLTTIFFELRHGFLLTHLMFVRGPEQQKSLEFMKKVRDVFQMTSGLPDYGSAYILFALVGVLIAWGVFEGYKNKKKYFYLLHLSVLLILSLIAALAVPFDMQPHYVFGLATVLFFTIAHLPYKQLFLCVVVLAYFYFSPRILTPYFVPAHRTVAQLDVCAKQICEREKEPMYVSLQGFYQFHAGPEYRFVFKKHGCDVRIIEEEQTSTDRMAVVVDNSTYEHGKTTYNELTQFGVSQDIQTYVCDGDIQVHMLKR